MKILDSNCEVTCQLKPRIRHETYIAPETEKEKIHWTVSMSVFREYKNDTDVYYLFKHPLNPVFF